jgi:hypothetical protein
MGVQNSGQYVSIVAMLIESAALYAVWSTVFLICYARNTPFQNILLPPLGQVQVSPHAKILDQQSIVILSRASLPLSSYSGLLKVAPGRRTLPM